MAMQDDLVYLGLLLFSILFGQVVRQVPLRSPSSRRLASTLCGLAILAAVAKQHSAYCLACYALQVAILTVVPWRWAHAVSFFAQFSYLLFFRMAPQVRLHRSEIRRMAV